MIDLGSPAPSAPTASWMVALSEHFARARKRYPDDELCVVFDIDGTIVDVRHLVVHALLGYDRHRQTEHFRGLVADDITTHEDDVEALLTTLSAPDHELAAIAEHYRGHLWDDDAVLAATRPLPGVLGVIRWFQLQSATHVAVVTGRSHRIRQATLSSLNSIGRAFRVAFDDDLLYTAEPSADVPRSKARALRDLRERGFRVVAVVDNEPANLRAMAGVDPGSDAIFLHADTISTSEREPGEAIVTGRDYRLAELVPRRSVPDEVALVWHGVNDRLNLERFLASAVSWAEVDVRSDPLHRLVLRHDAFDVTPWRRDEPTLSAREALDRLAAAGRSIKLDVKEGGRTVDAVIEMTSSLGVDPTRLWFNAEITTLGDRGFAELASRFPGATVSCPVDFLVPLLLTSGDAVDRVLETLARWGVTRASVSWASETPRVLDALTDRGWKTNVYGIVDLEAFLEACLLLPTSVTADFDFPAWGYRGRGSGADGTLHMARP